ncbi:hypothetical protein Bca4012_028924 [Brassica carinata]|uniref:Uncharacterized protein n=1 Tax=Brassica carinata TaxID=52824 RepID=A0A8X7RIX4_BRACI|nr:hypothetical protein Bca52824_049622 [Brassica carinata]
MPTPTATSLVKITKTLQARYTSCNTHIGYGKIFSPYRNSILDHLRIYPHQLESCSITLTQLKQEIQRARSQEEINSKADYPFAPATSALSSRELQSHNVYSNKMILFAIFFFSRDLWMMKWRK